MKIGIITFTYGQNYGNKLQNYALLSVLKKMYGKEVYTLQNFDTTTKGNLNTKVKKIIKYVIGLKAEREKVSKQKKFDEYSEKFLHYYSIPLMHGNTKKLQDFDAFVCGSDQIWNPYYNKDIDLFSASFSKKAKRISYAASIGLSSCPEKYKKLFSNCIGTMDSIGVREKEAKKILSELTDKDISIQIDPTMLLTKKEWEKLEEKPHGNIPTKYILTYFVCAPILEVQETIQKFASKKGLEIVSLNDETCKKWYDLSPNEFLYMIHHADFICADSFHATVFSILFGKAFHCFERNSGEKENKQESRLLTLLSYFGLEKRLGIENKIDDNSIDKKSIDAVLEKLRYESIEYLKRALGDK